MKAFTNAKQAVAKFHKNEDGLEALQIVMIIAIAALVLIAVKDKWPEIRDWMIEQLDSIMEFEGS